MTEHKGKEAGEKSVEFNATEVIPTEVKASEGSGKEWTEKGSLDKVVEASGDLREKSIDEMGKRNMKTIVQPPCY